MILFACHAPDECYERDTTLRHAIRHVFTPSFRSRRRLPIYCFVLRYDGVPVVVVFPSEEEDRGEFFFSFSFMPLAAAVAVACFVLSSPHLPMKSSCPAPRATLPSCGMPCLMNEIRGSTICSFSDILLPMPTPLSSLFHCFHFVVGRQAGRWELVGR